MRATISLKIFIKQGEDIAFKISESIKSNNKLFRKTFTLR
ncbi:hypothetical protein YN1HA_5140 [Sulfurisphaera ohwakuensis]